MDRGFILYLTYEVQEDEVVVQLFGKLENGETFRADIPQVPYFFIREDQVEEAKSFLELDVHKTQLKTLQGVPVVKVMVPAPKDVPPIRNELTEAGILTYEADVRFAYRYLIDNDLTTGIGITGEYRKGTYVDRVYKSPVFSRSEKAPEFTVLSLDIECSKQKDLWSVALSTKDRQEVIIVGKKVEGVHCCPTVRDALEKLNELIADIDPDIITGWNVIDFDLKFLQGRYEEQGVPWSWARSSRECKLRVYNDFLQTSMADIPGRMVLDGLQLLRMSFIKLESYSLENVAQEFLGEGKLFGSKHRYEDIKKAYEEDPKTLLEYNVKDTTLVLDILEETGVLELTITRSLITGMQLDRVRASIASLDMVYLPRLRERGFVAPTGGYIAKEERITGGFVMSSKPGIYDYVAVCDFKSLYPSIMLTLNIDPLAYLPQIEVEESSDDFIRAENGAVFSQEEGILPKILSNLWERREAATKKGDMLTRNALKILMNSFFGVLASPNCRFFSLDMANAITHTGQHIIKTAAQKLREEGYEVIYGDTDSLFIDLKTQSEEDAHKIGSKIESDLNVYVRKYMEDRYKRDSYLELEFEKIFLRFLMPQTRSGEGSKKRYAGLVRKGDKMKIDFTGLEFVRRDWTELAKEFQLGILDLIFARKDPKPFIRKYVEELRVGKKNHLLVYRKALRKDLSEYTKTTPPHVKAARLMKEVNSPIIEYMMTVDGPEPVENVQHSIDYEHYVDKQLEPIANGVLVFYNTSFNDVLLGTEQKGLFDF